MTAIIGERLTFGQSKGSDIELIVYGDEFYARYETPDGYTVVYDRDKGMYCYANVKDGLFTSTRIPIHKIQPVGLRKHLKESVEQRNQKFSDRFHMLQQRETGPGSGVHRTFGPNSGLLQGVPIHKGEVKGLTILVEFDDLSTTITKDQVHNMLNDIEYQENGNYCSIRKYFMTMSEDKLEFTNDVVGPIKLSRRRSYYIDNSLVREAVLKAVNDEGVDLSKYDSMSRGVVDALSIMYAGRTQYNNWLWPHNSINKITVGNMRTHYYTLQSLGRRQVDLSIGTFAHEAGHMLMRFPDLYDYGDRDGDYEKSSGLGRYCLMSSGNHLGSGKKPSLICAYLRGLADWPNQVVRLNNPDTYGARHEDFNTLLKYETDRENEYFLVENRSGMGFDEKLPDSGLAVYHCDTKGSNEWQEGSPSRHYQVALLQADGRRDLETNPNNRGDAQDLYDTKAGLVLSYETNPSSRQWDGADSGFKIFDVDNLGEVIGFKTGIKPDETTVTKDVTADLLIPDNDPSGVPSKMTIDKNGKLKNIQVRVDISHTYRGDLRVELISPKGTNVVLHKKKQDHMDDLVLNLDSKKHDGLAKLEGEAIQGEWTLHVKDLWEEDFGRLNTWGLTIDFKNTDKTVAKELLPDLAIPDADPEGVPSSISVSETGKLKDVRVGVNIEHTYRGDLQLELITPNGQSALLKTQSHDSTDHVDETYTVATAPALKAIVGTKITGDWQLRVRDLVGADTGMLRKWNLTLVY